MTCNEHDLTVDVTKTRGSKANCSETWYFTVAAESLMPLNTRLAQSGRMFVAKNRSWQKWMAHASAGSDVPLWPNLSYSFCWIAPVRVENSNNFVVSAVRVFIEVRNLFVFSRNGEVHLTVNGAKTSTGNFSVITEKNKPSAVLFVGGAEKARKMRKNNLLKTNRFAQNT